MAVALLSAAALGLTACGGGDDAAGAPDGALTGEITVSAAASLKEAFSTVAEDFEAAHPGTTVTLNFGSSGDLATQIQSGAPADVAAFAAESNMTTLADGGLLDGGYQIFATNSLVIVTKPGNPAGVEHLSDLATVGTVSLCVDTAPCGMYAAQILAKAGVTIPSDAVTRGQDVRATLAAVSDGDADAGIVYVTDAAAVGGAVATVDVPPADNAVAGYPIAVVKATGNTAVAEAFVADVLGPRAQAVLKDAGFGAP